MSRVYSVFLINRATVVEPVYLLPLLSFSPKLFPILLVVSKQPLLLLLVQMMGALHYSFLLKQWGAEGWRIHISDRWG